MSRRCEIRNIRLKGLLCILSNYFVDEANMYPAFHFEIRSDKAESFGSLQSHVSVFLCSSHSSEDRYMKPLDSFQLNTVQDLTADPALMQAAPSNSDIRGAGHMFSSPAECPDDIPFSSVSQHDKQFRDSPFISQKISDNGLFPPTHSSHSEMHSTSFVSHPLESDEIAWGPDPFQDLLNFPENVSVQNHQVENNTCHIPDDNAKKTDFGEWVEQLMFADDSLHPNWSQLLGDGNVTDSKSKVCFSHWF